MVSTSGAARILNYRLKPGCAEVSTTSNVKKGYCFSNLANRSSKPLYPLPSITRKNSSSFFSILLSARCANRFLFTYYIFVALYFEKNSYFYTNIYFLFAFMLYSHFAFTRVSELGNVQTYCTNGNVNPIIRRTHRYPGNRAVLARGSHLQETFALQVAQRRERAQEEQHKAERSVAGRVCQVLLSEDRSRQGEYLCIVACINFLSYAIPYENATEE